MGKHPSFKRIIKIDLMAFYSFSGAAGVAGVSTLLFFTTDHHEMGPIASLSLAAIVFFMFIVPAGLLAWRIWEVYAIFAKGIEVPALIERVSPLRKMVRIDYRYSFQGQKYRQSVSVVNLKETREMQSGIRVTALVDRHKPERALIRRLYA